MMSRIRIVATHDMVSAELLTIEKVGRKGFRTIQIGVALFSIFSIFSINILNIQYRTLRNWISNVQYRNAASLLQQSAEKYIDSARRCFDYC